MPAPHTRWRGWRWILRGALGLVALIVVVVGAALIALHTDWGRELLRTQVAKQLQTTFTGGATLGRLEGSPFGELVLHDVVINGPDRRPAISVKTLRVQVGILPLLSHQARVGAVIAEDVDVALRRSANGELEIKQLMRPGPKSKWSVALPRVQVRRGHVMLDAGSQIVNLDGLTIDARAELPFGGPIDTGVELHGTWRERGAARLDLQAVVHTDASGLKVSQLSVRAGDVTLVGDHLSVITIGGGRVPAIAGAVTLSAGAAAVARLVPEIRLPDDIALTVTASPMPPTTTADRARAGSGAQCGGAAPCEGQPIQLTIAARVGQADLRFTGSADLDARRVRGELHTGALDLTKLSSGKIVGRAAGDAVFDVRPGEPGGLPVATATIRGWGAVAGLPTTTFDIDVSSAGETAHAAINATGNGIHATLVGTVRMAGELLAIESATLHAETSDPERASGGKAPVHGALRVDLAAHGTLRPAPALAVTGTIDGRKLRMNDLSVASLHVAVDAKRLPNRPYGTAHVVLSDIVRGEMQLGQLTLDATDRADGKIAVAVRSQPKQNPWLFEADALVTPPAWAAAEAAPVASAAPSLAPKPARPATPSVVIDLVRHHVRAGAGEDWFGQTGHIEVGPERIVVRDLTTASKTGRVAVAASYERAGRQRGDLAATIDARSLSLDNVARVYHGMLDGHVEIARRAGAWQGALSLDAVKVSVDATLPPDATVAVANAGTPAATAPRPGPPTQRPPVVLDAHARGTLRGTQLAISADVASAGLGGLGLAVELDAPAAITDPKAWQRLGRSAVRTAALTLRGIDVARAAELTGLAGHYTGRIDGAIQVAATTVSGRIATTNLAAPQLRGLAGVDLVLDMSQKSAIEITPQLTVTVAGIGKLVAQADLAAPDRLFEPAAWQALGPRVLRSASLRADNITIDPAMLDRFGVVAELRGKLSLAVDVSEGARTIQTTVDVAALRGQILQPIDVHLVAAVGERETTASLSVAAKSAPLLEVQARLPGSLVELAQRMQTDPKAVAATPLSATATLASVDAVRLLGVFGRTEVTGGRIDGTVALGGTLGAPSVSAKLVATALKVPPGPRGKPVRTVDQLTLTASWDGRAAKLDLEGTESEGGTLKLSAVANPSALREGKLTIKANKLDLVPLLAFAPGPAGAASGELDADLTVTGLDLRTMQVAGELHLREARVPVAPTVGTLRRAKIDAVIANHEVKIKIDGKLGSGTVVLDGSIALDGGAPNGGKAKLTLRNVSPIGTVEPRVSADVSATLSHENNQWRADLVVDNGNVIVPTDRGERLKPPGPPADMTFASGKRITNRPLVHQAPSNPIFVVNIELRSTYVESEEFRGALNGKLRVRADGEAIGMFGEIAADAGDLDLFGHRYYVERAGVAFDGSLDPLLDVRITHDFADATTVTEVRGRVSAPELTLSSDPGTYSQSELLGFLLGGEPGGDAPGAGADRVADAGTSFVANQLGGYVKKALPIDIDVLRYEAATAATGAAVLVGSWITHTLFIAYRQHLESRADENTGEGEVEYWLSRRLMIEATAGDRGYNGVDLLWRKRY